MPKPPPSNLDLPQILQAVHDESTGTLRTTATAVIVGGDLEVIINQDSDSIQIYGNDGVNNQPIKTDSEGNLQVDVLSSVLPANAATESKQDIGNASLASIDTKLTNPLPVSGTITVTATDLDIRDLQFATDSVDVTGSDVSISNFPATQPISGTVSVDNFPTTQVVSATNLDIRDLVFSTDKIDTSGSSVLVNNFPASQVVEGTVTVDQGTTPWDISGSVDINNFPSDQLIHGPVSQSGTWNINNITGTVSLPTGASTSANQVIANASLSSIDSKLTSPITVTSTDLDIRNLVFATDKVDVSGSDVTVSNTVTVDQGTSPWVVTGTLTDSDVNIHDGVGNALTSQVSGSQQALDVGINVAGIQIDPRNTRLLTATDVVTANAGTGTFQTNVTNSSIPVTQSGTWNITNITGTATLPTGAATESTLSTLNLKVPSNLTVTSTRLLVDGSGVTQPVSGSVSVSNFPATQAVTQSTSPWVVDGSATTQPISAAALPLPTGASTSANQITEITALQILDDVPSTMNGAFSKGNPAMGQLDDTSTTVATEDNVAPVRITAQRAFHTNLRNTAGTEIATSANPLRIDPTGSTTQPVSGTITANAGTGNFTVIQATGTNLHTVVDSGSIAINNASGASAVNIQDGGNSITVDGSVTVSGTVAATQSGTWNINNISGTSPLPTGASTSALQTTGNATLVSIDAGIPAALGQTTMSASMAVTLASDQGNINVIIQTNTIATYSAATNFVPVLLLPTDIFTLNGSATKVVKLRKIHISGVNTGNTNALINVIKRSTADTGGTSSVVTNVKHDSNDSSATAVVRAYTVNPTLGTSIGNISSFYIFFPTAASTNPSPLGIIEYGKLEDEPIVLRGTSEQIAVSLNGVTLGGTSTVSIKMEWTEE